jgi:hypothetical protein
MKTKNMEQFSSLSWGGATGTRNLLQRKCETQARKDMITVLYYVLQ